MEKIDKAGLAKIFDGIVGVMVEQREHLIELDALMGDGDLGLTMTNGFTSVRDEIAKIDATDMGVIFMKLGMKMNSTVPSTMGTLLSICFTKAASEVKGKTELTLEDAVNMGRAAVKGVMERGRTKLGDKTMLDALHPAVEALAIALAEGKSLKEAIVNAYQGAVDGVENTKVLMAVHGRAAYYKEKTLGRPDPGAVAVMNIFKGVKQSFE